jgi:hypothetical protein
MLERRDADALGTFLQEPAREIGRGGLRAVERDEALRVGLRAEGRERFFASSAIGRAGTGGRAPRTPVEGRPR